MYIFFDDFIKGRKMTKVYEVPGAQLGMVGKDSIDIEQFNLTIGYDSPARLNCTIIPLNEEENMSFAGEGYNLILETGENLGLWYPERITYTFDRIEISLFTIMQVFDFYPIINDDSDDGCYHFDTSKTLQDVVNTIVSSLPGLGYYINLSDKLKTLKLPSEKKYGNGESLLSILRDIADFSGAVMYDNIFYARVDIVTPTSKLTPGAPAGGKYYEDYVMNVATSYTNEFLYSQVFVRDTDGGLLRPVKKYSYKPYPYNKRAIFYTYRGLLDATKANVVAQRIIDALQIGDEQETIECLGFIPALPFDPMRSGFVLDVNYSYAYNENPFLYTTIRIAK